jgi:N-acetylmuramoyl-L-alanine amidase
MKTGQQLFELLAKHKGEKYHLGILVPKSDENYRGAWDCAEFVSWGIYQLTGKLFGCVKNDGNPTTADSYTGYIARDAESMKCTVPVEHAMRAAGALLLRIAGNGVTGHVAVSDGKEGTIEAHSTKSGVIATGAKGRRWDCGVMCPYLQHSAMWETSAPIAAVPIGPVYRLKKPVMQGFEIKTIQIKLNSLGFKCGKPDGVFGVQTYYAVKNFQLEQGYLVTDGEVGFKTLNALGLQ